MTMQKMLCSCLDVCLYCVPILSTQFSSFKAKTGGPTKTTPAGKVAAPQRSITGKSPAAASKDTPGKKDDKKPAAPRKEGQSACFSGTSRGFSVLVMHQKMETFF